MNINWISTENWMPKYGQECIVVIEDLEPPVFYHLVEWRDKWITLTDGKDLDSTLCVTHWMHAPIFEKAVVSN